MWQWMAKYRVWIVLWCLVLLPLVESLSVDTLWGLNWHSPMRMEWIHRYLIVLKLLFVLSAIFLALLLYLFPKFTTQLRYSTLMIVSVCLVSVVQLPMLGMGVTFAANASTAGQELKLDRQQFYVHTVDPGAMGKTYYNVYLECPKPWGRYELRSLGRVDWMLKPQFELQGDELVMTGERYPNPNVQERLSLAGHSCQFN